MGRDLEWRDDAWRVDRDARLAVGCAPDLAEPAMSRRPPLPRRPLLALAAALAPLAVGCGDDANDASALVGLYAVSSWTSAKDQCATSEPVVGSTHLYIKKASFFGVDTLEAIACPQADGCGQDPDAFPDFTFMQRSGSSWFTSAASASYLAPTCALGMSEQVLTPTADGIHIESTMKTLDFETTEAECTTAAAKQKASEMTCASKDVVDGKAL